MLGWEGSLDIRSLKSSLSHSEAGSCITTDSLSFRENTAQIPQLAADSSSEFGLYQPGPYSKECSNGGSAFTCPLEASLTEMAGLSTSQEGVKGLLDSARLKGRGGIGSFPPSQNGGEAWELSEAVQGWR